jgi:hypothetical protein
MDEIEDLSDEPENQDNKDKSVWISKKLFGDKKPKSEYSFNKKKRLYKLEPVPRNKIYEPIRRNGYYIHLKNNGGNKDEILCGVNERTFRINKVLYDCFTAAKLKSDERQMFQWVIANTTCYNRREVILNISQIAKDIGRTRSFVYGSLHRLSDRKMIFITTTRNGDPTIYINTMPNTWDSVGAKVIEIMGAEES